MTRLQQLQQLAKRPAAQYILGFGVQLLVFSFVLRFCVFSFSWCRLGWHASSRVARRKQWHVIRAPFNLR